MRSSGGFLAPGESFLDRLAEDDEKVAQLGVTHHFLATQLNSALVQSVNERRKIGLGPDPKVSFDFRCQPLLDESIPQLLTVTHRSFAGAQWSFFRNLKRGEGDETAEDTITWKEDHEIWNEAFPFVVLKLAGGIGTGIVHYISKHGFYEGGNTNPYRVDPAVLHWVLTGIPTKNALSALCLHYEACIEEVTAKFESDLQLLKTTTPPLEDDACLAIESHLRTACSEETREWSEKLHQIKAWRP